MGAGKRSRLLKKNSHRKGLWSWNPARKVIDVAKMNTGGKYDSLAFKKSVVLNGWELKQ
jgi:hypothetical protein